VLQFIYPQNEDPMETNNGKKCFDQAIAYLLKLVETNAAQPKIDFLRGQIRSRISALETESEGQKEKKIAFDHMRAKAEDMERKLQEHCKGKDKSKEKGRTGTSRRRSRSQEKQKQVNQKKR
jgi:hypothetical protein